MENKKNDKMLSLLEESKKISELKTFSLKDTNEKSTKENNGIAYFTYGIDKNTNIKIFGERFVGNNKTKCIMIIGGTKYQIKDKINLEDYGINKDEKKFKLIFKGVSITNMGYMFSNCQNLIDVNFSSFKTDNVSNMQNMFWGCGNLVNIDLSSFNTKNLTNLGNMFAYCSKLTKVDISSFNTQNVSNMDRMFYECNKLINIDLTSFNTQKVFDMEKMFYGCENLVKVDLSSFNIQNVFDMRYMFSLCNNLKEVKINRFAYNKIEKIASPLSETVFIIEV